MKALTDKLPRLAPPLWLTLVLATVVAASLLAAFVDTLRQNVRHGEELRQLQRGGVVRNGLDAMTNAAPRGQAPKLTTSRSPKFQR